MITKEILEAQITIYTNGRKQAAEATEKARADFNAFNGAIEALQDLIKLHDGLVAEQSKESSKEKVK